MIPLKYNTASQEIPLGYFLDSTDGDTAETGLTIANTDIKLWKSGAATLANKNSGGATHISGGVYYAVLDATDTNTYGPLKIFVHVSGALPCILECLVMEANAYDAHYAALGTGHMESDMVQISGDATAANNAESFFDGTGYAGTNNVMPTTTTVTNQVTADVTAVSGDTNAADNLEADYDGTGYAKSNSTIGTATAVTNQVTADTTAISGDSTAADNLESQYDGSGYTDDNAPATQSQVGNLTSGTAAINTTAESFTKAGAEPETNTYTATQQEDGTYHIVEDDATSTDAYYQFDVGGNGVPVSVTWLGYAQSNGDTYTIHAYNYGGTAYEQIGTIAASNGTTPITETYSLTNAHVGTGANLGKVRFRFLSADGTAFATDRLLCSYAVVSKSVGYADGAIWVDTDASNTNTEAYVDGVADNPVSTWAAALTLNTALGLDRFRIAGGSSITLTGDSSGYQLLGNGLFTLALGGQTISNAYIVQASISGTGAGSAVIFEDCQFNNSADIPPSFLIRCGIVAGVGTPLTANGSGEYTLVDCVSLVAGSGTPYLDFSGTGGTSGVNIRRWSGGINVTLDSNNTLSHEVLVGGGCTITTGGADVEIRGTTRAVTVAMSAAETVQFVGVTGPISLSGTTTATVNLHGVSTSITDTTSAATVTDNTVSQDNVNAEVVDALNVDTYAEPSGVPAATATLEAKIGWLAALARNKITQTSTTQTLRNDADGADIAASTVSDNGTTFTRGEFS